MIEPGDAAAYLLHDFSRRHRRRGRKESRRKT